MISSVKKNKLIVLSDILEYILLFAVIVECNTMYKCTTPLFFNLDVEIFLGGFIIVSLIADILIHWLYTAIDFKKSTGLLICLLGIEAYCAFFFFATKANFESAWAMNNFIRNFMVVLPLFIAVFWFKAIEGKRFDLFLKHADLTGAIGVGSLIVFLSSIINLNAVRSDVDYTTWSNGGFIVGHANLYNLVQFVNGASWQIADIALPRNYGFFTEPLMFTIPLIVALYTEMFIRDKENKYRIIRLVVLSATIVTAQSTMGMMLLALAWGMKLVQIGIEKKKNWMILSAVALTLVTVAFLYYEKKVGSFSIEQGGSIHYHLEDYVVAFKAFLNKPLFGGGYFNENYVAAFMPPERIVKNKGVSNSIAIIFGHGGLVLGLFCLFPFLVCFSKIRSKEERKIFYWMVGGFSLYVVTVFYYHVFMMMLLAFGFSLLIPCKELKLDAEEVITSKITDNVLFKKICLVVCIAVCAFLLFFGKPFWNAVYYLLRTNGWSISLSPPNAFFLNSIIIISAAVLIYSLKGRLNIKWAIAILLTDMAYLATYKEAFSVVTTFLAFKGLDSTRNVSVSLFVLFLLSLGFIYGAIALAYKVKKVGGVLIFWAAVGIYVLTIAFMPKALFGSKTGMIADNLSAIAPVLQNALGKVYVNDMPALYHAAYSGISYSGTKGAGFDACENSTVIFYKGANYKEFFDAGFEVTELSGNLIAYSNDIGVIQGLKGMGYEWDRYYPFSQPVSLWYCADMNGITILDNGNILLEGEEKGLTRGPYSLLEKGQYTVTYRLHVDIDKYKDMDPETNLATAKADYYSGAKDFAARKVILGDFDEEGNAEFEMKFSADKMVEGVEYLLMPKEDYQIEVCSIEVNETPEYITVTKQNILGNIIREEYYDVEGEAYLHKEGFAAVERDFDLSGRQYETRYFGKDGERTRISSGYSAIRYAYNRKKRVVSEEYYDENDQKVELSSGIAEERFEYDDDGNRCEYRYYDGEGKPVLYSALYHCLKREYDQNANIVAEMYYGIEGEPVLFDGKYWKIVKKYDDDKRCIHEEYYGVDGELTEKAEGFAGIDRVYDDNGNEIDCTYLGKDLKPVITTYGYAEIRKTYTEFNLVEREEYYDENRKLIALAGGKAIVCRSYDVNNYVKSEEYYGIEGEKILVNGLFFRFTRQYDEKKQCISEQYFGTDENLILLPGGYAGCYRSFDENGNVVHLTYLGLDGNPVITDWGYSICHRLFNDKKQIIREEYYGVNDEKILRPGGQQAVEYTYDDMGNCNSETYFGINNERILVNGTFWKVVRIYNENKENTHEEYFGTDGEHILLLGSYSGVDFVYDDNNVLIKKIFMDNDGNIVNEQSME